MRKQKSSVSRIDFSQDAVAEIAGALLPLLADVFTLYFKTKNFHWHMTGPHSRDYHELLDEQAQQIFAMTDRDRRAREENRRCHAPRSISEFHATNG